MTDKDDILEKEEAQDVLDEETLFIVSQTFKALSDPTRIKLLYFLSKNEHSVNQIVESVGMLQTTISHQLSF